MLRPAEATGACSSRASRSAGFSVSWLALVAIVFWSMPARTHADCHDGIWQAGEFCGYDARIATGEAEMNHDCIVDYLDLALFSKQMNTVGPNLSADLNGSGRVDNADLALFSTTYGLAVAPCTPGGMRPDSCGGRIMLSFDPNPANIVPTTALAASTFDTVYVVVDSWSGAQSLEYAVEASSNVMLFGQTTPYMGMRSCNPTPQQSYIAILNPSTWPAAPVVVATITYMVTNALPATFAIKTAPGCAQPMRLRWAESPHDRSIDFAIVMNAGINGPAPAGQGTCASLPPTVTIEVPPGADTVPWPQMTYDFSGTASDPDGSVALVEYRVNAAAWQPATGTTSWSFSVSGLVVGGNVIEVRARDDFGLYSPVENRTITRLANVVPVVAIVIPPADTVVAFTQGTCDLWGTASDTDGVVEEVEFRVNGSPWSSATGTTSWSLTATLAVGANVVEVRARDDADEYSSLDSCTVSRLAAPDLQVSGFESPAAEKRGCKAIPVTFTITNAGAGPAGSCRASLRWSEDAAITSGDAILAVFDIAGLGASQNAIVSTDVVLTPDGPRGDVYLGILVDDLMAVTESDESNNTRTNAFSHPVPLVTAITDVGNDQGRQVRITMLSSTRDAAGSPTPVLQYEAFRRIDPLPSMAGMAKGGDPDVKLDVPSMGGTQTAEAARAAGMISHPGILASGWEFVGAIPAHQEMEYSMIAPTLADSSLELGIYFSVFFLRAATADPGTFFDACADSGYSLDNLAPNVPLGFVANKAPGSDVTLTWQPSAEQDLRFYTLYRGAIPGFVPATGNRIAQLVEITYVDTEASSAQNYYKLSATDFAGNESAYALASPDVTDAGPAQPTVFALVPLTSNPVQRVHLVRFDLPHATPVTLRIYDVRGRPVRTGFGGTPMPAGNHRWTWDLCNDRGAAVAPGVYFQRFEAAGFSRTLKIVVVSP